MTNEEAQKVWELIKPLKVGMLVSSSDQELHARPMHLVQPDFNGSLYFFSDSGSLKADEIEKNPDVCIAFSCPKSQTYVSISGIACRCKDQALINQFWNPFVAAWFPQGKEDPTVILLEIKTFRAECWNATANKVSQLFAYAKALITDKRPQLGEHALFK